MAIFYPRKHASNSNLSQKLHKKSLVIVEKNLFSGKYTHSPWRFIKDVNEAFEAIKSSYTKKAKIFAVTNEVS